MTELTKTVKPAVANLKNVASALILVERLRGRTMNMPGLGVFHGRSGYGKTVAAIFIQNKTNAIRVEMGVTWTRKNLLRNILVECGLSPREIPNTIADLAETAIMELGSDPKRPLIIDEADIAVDKGMVEVVRELHDKSGAPILLVGEEQLPDKLQRSERTDNRVLDWVQAQPCDPDDTNALARHYCNGIILADDLLVELNTRTRGVARRICVNLEHIREHCTDNQIKSIDLAAFRAADIPLYTGERRSIRRAR